MAGERSRLGESARLLRHGFAARTGTATMNALPSHLLADVPRGHIAPCPHWWKLESPHGTPTVHGVCKRCGAERDYPTAETTQGSPNQMPWIKHRDVTHVDGRVM